MRELPLFLLPFILVPLGGCQNHVGIEEISLRHKDEIRKKYDLVLVADRRVFAVMAFANAVGFNEEAKGQRIHPVRARVRDMVMERAAGHPEKLRRWEEYYKKTFGDTCSIVAFAPSLSADYPFQWISPHHPLGYISTDERFEQLPEILNSFWETVDLGGIWAEVKPTYIEEMNRYDLDLMKRQLRFTWQYLRMQRDDSDMFVQIPNLLGTHYSTCSVRHDNCLCSIEGPGSSDHTFNVHEYLHSIVNEIVTEHYPRYADKLKPYYDTGNKGLLAESYQDPVVFTYECLVRALDRRMRILLADNQSEIRTHKDAVERDTHRGLTLTRPFFMLLAEFEETDMPFDQFVPMMFEKLPEDYRYAHEASQSLSDPVSSSTRLARRERRKPYSADSMKVMASVYTSLCLE